VQGKLILGEGQTLAGAIRWPAVRSFCKASCEICQAKRSVTWIKVRSSLERRRNAFDASATDSRKKGVSI